MGFLSDVGRSVSRIATGGIASPLNILDSRERGLDAFNPFRNGLIPSFMVPGPQQGSFNQQVGKGLSASRARAPIPPNVTSANMFANNRINEDQRRRLSSSQTLFTSGQGVLDSPLIASAILLGS